MGFSQQEHWSSCHFLLQGILRSQGSTPGFPATCALADRCFYQWAMWEAHELATGVHMIFPSWNSLTFPTLSHPFRLLQSPSLSSLSHMANSHWLFILHLVEVRFLRQSPYLTFFAIWIGDLVKIIVTVLKTIKRKVTSDVSGTQTLKDSNFKGFQH